MRNLIEWITDKLDHIDTVVRCRLPHMIKSFFYYGWVFRGSYDFDDGYLYLMIHVKLKRMYKHFREEGHTVWSGSNTRSMIALIECIELSKRIANEDVHAVHHVSAFFDKYKTANKSNLFGLLRKGKNRKIISDKMYNYFFKKASARDDRNKKYIYNRFHYLFKKFSTHWWD